jgi:DNA-binding beta-propeller fold protein YncE
MAQAFNCPNCSAPLSPSGDEPTLRCPYCNGSVIVPDALRNSYSDSLPTSAPQIGGTPWVGGALLSPEQRLREIAQQIRGGNKNEAVRIYRDTFSVGLNEATQAIEALQAGRPILMPGAVSFGAVNADTESNPSITTAFTPQAFTTSTRGTTYTHNAAFKQPASFIVYWVRFSLLGLPVAFALVMLGLLFPNTARLAAPVWCPENYIDAYGTVESSHDSSDGSTGYNLVFNCVDIQLQVTQPNGFLAGATIFGLYAAAGVVIAFGLAALFRFKWVGCLPLGLVLVLVPIGFVIYASSIPSRSGNPLLRLIHVGTEPHGPVDIVSTPSVSLTPQVAGLANVVTSFGNGKGEDPGFFNDTRMVAVDEAGNIYAADYGGGRIQVFNAQGQFVNQWQVSDGAGSIYITGLAVTPDGTLYAVHGGDIHQYEGATGKALGQLKSDDSFIKVAAIAPDGDLVALSDKSILRFDSTGKQVLKITDWAKALTTTGNVGVDDVALDRDGFIYIADSSANAIYKFTAKGTYVAKLGQTGKAAGQFDDPRTLTFDSAGRLYVEDFKGIQVFSVGGKYLGLIKIEGLGFDLAANTQDQLIFMDRNASKIFVYSVPES